MKQKRQQIYKSGHADYNALDTMRHSCAHLLAAAVMELWPKARLGVGPTTENGFYYDFDLPVKISEADFPAIEKKMAELKARDFAFERSVLGIDLALKRTKKIGQPYKQELLGDLRAAGETEVSFYQSGDFVDLCKGPHVANVSAIGPFKLLSVAGAYWKGSEKNKMLTRIYGTCFASNEELDAHLQMIEESKKRDHRKLGQELDLFSISPLTGQGLILWHPKLATVRNIVEQFWREEHYKRGYQLVFTPHIASVDMFVTSRHLSKYINYMFPIMLHELIEGESAPDYSADEVLKPMNCPNHIQIYKAKPRSWRELPLRIGELGTVYRYERAGVLHGMTRVRGFTQDDSHIFCTPDQVIAEVRGVLQIMKEFYKIFGFRDYQAYIATRPEKYLGNLAMWNFAEDSLKKAASAEGFEYKIDEGAGVFYGPKIDMKVKDSLGREWQLGTVQFDFNQPDRAETTQQDIEEFWALKTFKQKFKTKENLTKYLKRLGRGFDVNYVNAHGKTEHCVMIHRVVLGSMERFFGILIEHYGGAFPVWLAPVQAKVLPIADRHLEYGRNVVQQLKGAGIRAELDDRSETLSAKIRDGQHEKVPYLLIVGDKELEANTVSVRAHGKDLGKKTIEQVCAEINQKVNQKTLD